MFQTTFVEGDTGILFVGSGVVTADEIRSSKLQLFANCDRLQQVEFAIVDFQVASSLILDADDLRRIVDLDRQLALLVPNACVAIVAPKDYMFGLARMWETTLEVAGWKTQVFRSTSDACPWVREMSTSNEVACL